MSPLWNKRLSIYLSPDRINLRLWGRGLHPRLLAQHEEVIEQAEAGMSGSALASSLEQLLAQPDWQQAEVDVVLSNRLVHYAVVPFSAQLKKYAEQEAFARHALSRTYGSVAEQWELRIQQGRAGAPALVCAVDKVLLEQLRHVCIGHKLKLKLRSVQPQLMQVVNRHGDAIKADPAWLVSSEPGYSQLALLQGGTFVAVSGASHESMTELPILLDRENLASALAGPCKAVSLYAAEGVSSTEFDPGGYEICQLDGQQQARLTIAQTVQTLKRWLKPQLMLDFQRPVNQPSRRAGWLLLVTGLALLLDMGITYDRLHHQRAAMDQEIKTSNIRFDEGNRSSSSTRYSDRDLEQAQQIVSRLTTPWDQFFTGLESVANKDVAILAITPDMQSGQLRIDGEAKDYAAILTLIAQLRTTKPFSNVYLLNHDIKRDDPQHPFNFSLTMRWAGQHDQTEAR